jgi:hypothetical protein
MKTTIDMAREAGIEFQHITGILGKETISTMGSQRLERIEQLVALVRADERNRTWTQEHWTEYERSIAAVEREACAKVCDDRAFQFFSESPFFVEMHGLADAIRARGNT